MRSPGGDSTAGVSMVTCLPSNASDPTPGPDPFCATAGVQPFSVSVDAASEDPAGRAGDRWGGFESGSESAVREEDVVVVPMRRGTSELVREKSETKVRYLSTGMLCAREVRSAKWSVGDRAHDAVDDHRANDDAVDDGNHDLEQSGPIFRHFLERELGVVDGADANGAEPV